MIWYRRHAWCPYCGILRMLRIVRNWMILIVVVEERSFYPLVEQRAKRKGIRPPKRRRRKRMRRSSRWHDSRFNLPSRMQIDRDDQVFGARPFCLSRCPPILTRPRPSGPAAKGTFERKTLPSEMISLTVALVSRRIGNSSTRRAWSDCSPRIATTKVRVGLGLDCADVGRCSLQTAAGEFLQGRFRLGVSVEHALLRTKVARVR